MALNSKKKIEKRYILALDEGTTSARAVIYDIKTNKITAIRNRQIDLIYKQSGWVEQDANSVWASQYGALNEVIAESGLNLKEVISLGITNQRETVLLWDKESGLPLSNAIVWQCRRTADYCQELKDAGYQELISRKTGLIIDAYFSASKIKWLLDNIEGAREKAERNEICCGTMDSYLVYRLTEGRAHITDCTNASRTMLMNINTMEWDDELLELFDIPKNIMPKIVASDEVVGQTHLLKESIDICGIIGDQQSALFGQACFHQGQAKNTYGTGCFILLNIGDEVKHSNNALVTTVAWVIDGKPTYAFEGSVFNAGSSIQWLRDGLGVIDSSAESYEMAIKAFNADGSSGCDGVYFVPAFTGLGAPYWNQDARGIIVGITRNTNKYHIIRATLESMAYSTKEIIELMEKECGNNLLNLAVDGGASANDFLMQFQANILNVNIERPVITESTVLGAVFMSGYGMKVFKSLEEIKGLRELQSVFIPYEQEKVEKLYKGWKKAVIRSLDWN